MTDSSTEVEILSYLVDHPSASDTLRGIAEWWLLEQRITTGIETVRAALERLTELGFIVAQRKRGQAELYRIIKHKLPEIRNWLASQRNSFKT
jgi:hypothetical protein